MNSFALQLGGISTQHRAAAKSAVSTSERLLGEFPFLAGINDDDTYDAVTALYEQILRVMPEEGEEVDDPQVKALVWLERLMGGVLADYADTRWPAPEYPGGTPAAVLRVIMDERGLTQSDLPELGSQGVVSELLNGKREFNLRHVRALSHRFGVPVRFFLGD